jgi:hypothetical protein
MGLTATDGARSIIELTYVWNSAKDNEEVWKTARTITEGVEKALAARMQKVRQAVPVTGQKVETYLPLFLNDVMFDQKPIQSYKNYDAFAALQRSADPGGFFKRPGGYKY